MPKGKKSTRQKLEEHFDKPISAILKDFEGIKTSAEAAKKVATITNKAITATPLTMERMAASLSLNTKHHPWAVPKEKGRRGKMPIRERLETKTKKSIWEILESYKDQSREEAAEALNVNVVSLRRLIEQALEANEEEAQAYEKWTVKRKRGRRTGDSNTPEVAREEILTPIIYECRECGHKRATRIDAALCKAPDWDTAARAKRCPHCNKWGRYNITIKDKKGDIYMVSDKTLQSEETHEYYQTNSAFTKRIEK